MKRPYLSYQITLYHTVNFTFFFFNDTATTEIYTLSLHDALPICVYGPESGRRQEQADLACGVRPGISGSAGQGDRKSTRLNSSHSSISYAVFCLKKKNRNESMKLRLYFFTL